MSASATVHLGARQRDPAHELGALVDGDVNPDGLPSRERDGTRCRRRSSLPSGEAHARVLRRDQGGARVAQGTDLAPAGQRTADRDPEQGGFDQRVALQHQTLSGQLPTGLREQTLVQPMRHRPAAEAAEDCLPRGRLAFRPGVSSAKPKLQKRRGDRPSEEASSSSGSGTLGHQPEYSARGASRYPCASKSARKRAIGGKPTLRGGKRKQASLRAKARSAPGRPRPSIGAAIRYRPRFIPTPGGRRPSTKLP